MKLNRKQFIVFKRICDKYHIAVESVKFNHLKVRRSDFQRRTWLKFDLWKPKDTKQFRFIIKYNNLVHTKFWFNQNRVSRAIKRYKIHSALVKLYTQEIHNDKDIDTANWISQTGCSEVETEYSVLGTSKDIIEVSEHGPPSNTIPQNSNTEDQYGMSDNAMDFNQVSVGIDEENLFELIEEEPEEEEIDEVEKEDTKEFIISQNPKLHSSPLKDPNAKIVDSILYKMKSPIIVKNIPKRESSTEEPKEAIEETEQNFSVSFLKPSHPMQLPTPIVEKKRDRSEFLSEDNEMEFDNNKKLKDIKIIGAVGGVDATKMMKMSEPPEFSQPKRPKNMEKPRTVAEKRLMLSKNDLRIRSMEQEDKLFHQIRKKSNNLPVDYDLLDYLLVSSVPARRSPWRALTWLRTKEGNYIYKVIKIDGHELKIVGSVGNHKSKYIENQTSKPLPKRLNVKGYPCCKPLRVSERLKRSLIRNKSLQKFLLGDDLPDPEKAVTTQVTNKTLLERKLSQIPAAPLSVKLKILNDRNSGIPINDEDIYLGDYMQFKMPKIKLEVTLQPNKPVEPLVKRYLKEVLPHKDISQEWMEFALFPLKCKQANNEDEDSTQKQNVFSFDIPYEENKDSIVVRKILKKNENWDESGDKVEEEFEWQFDKSCDKTDELEMEVVEVIKDLTNSTLINLNDDLYTKEDDTLCTPKTEILQITQGTSSKKTETVTSPKSKKKKFNTKVLMELRRLNANFVNVEDENSMSNDHVCTNEHCSKGCICDSVNPAQSEKTSLSVQEMEHLRKKATSNLAKEEKDFRPTIILTDSDPLLVRNVENERRRPKRLPKKYSDFLEVDEAVELYKRRESEVVAPPMFAKKNKTRGKFSINNQPESQSSEVSKASEKNFINIEHFRQSARKSQEVSTEIATKMEAALRRMMHVNVTVRKLINCYDIEPFCMSHNCYKCVCNLKSTQGHTFDHEDFMNGENWKPVKKNRKRSIEEMQPIASTSKRIRTSIEDQNNDQGCEMQIAQCISLNPLQKDDEKVTRCAPVNSEFYKMKNKAEGLSEVREKSGILFRDLNGQRRIEIANLIDLVNERKGPIFINIYDCRLNRLNDVMRTLLINDNAIIYVDGVSYYLDKSSGVDVTKINFNPILNDIEHPIFILQKKSDANLSPPNENDIPEDFIQMIHRDNFVVVETNKKKLKAISDIIDNVLKGVKKRVEKKMLASGNSDNNVLKEQLQKISRERKSSCSTSMSDASSPLFMETALEQDLKNEREATQDVAVFNKLFTNRMKKFIAILRSNSLGLKPCPQLVNRYYLYRWDVLLKSFEENLNEIWLAFYEENNNPCVMMAMTRKPFPPPIRQALSEDIVNIRKMDPFDSKTPALCKMILLRLQNARTKNLVVLLYGCIGYFKICGCMNSPVDYTDNNFVAKPTPEKNPLISEKILKVYNFWQKFKGVLKEEVDEAIAFDYKANLYEKPLPKKPVVTEKPSTSGIKAARAAAQQRIAEAAKAAVETEPPPATPPVSMFPASFSLYPGAETQFKYHLFTIQNDFSDLYVKAWNRFVPQEIITRIVNRSRNEDRIVRLSPKDTVNYKNLRLYALPEHPFHKDLQGDFVAIGPYDYNESDVIHLMQRTDEGMLTRNEYERKYDVYRSLKTTSLWVFSDSDHAFETYTRKVVNPFAKTYTKKASVTSTVTSTSELQPNPESLSLKISNVIENYQAYNPDCVKIEKTDESNVIDDVQEGQGSSFESNASLPQLIIGDVDGEVKTLSQFQNQPWTSIQKDPGNDEVKIKVEPEDSDDGI